MAIGAKTPPKVKPHLTRRKSAVQRATDQVKADLLPMENVTQMTDVRYYMRKLAHIAARVGLGKDNDGLTAAEATKLQDYYAKQFELVNGIPLKEATQGMRDPIERLKDTSVLEHTEDELNELESAIRGIDELGVPKKKRWLNLIERVRALQKKAKASAIAMWTYVGRDSETGKVFHMQQIQARFFETWNDDRYPHSLTMAPPGHSKTTCLRGQVIWDIANDPTLRVLILYDTDSKALKETPLLKSIMRGKLFRALYPHVRVLGRDDDAEDSRRRFTVARKNTGSREPTVEGAAIMSQINGNGYDHIYVDDPCPALVAQQPATRDNINFKWNNEVEERLRNPARARIRMVCTPWHEEDLAGHIQRQVGEGAREGWRIAIDEFRVNMDVDGVPISLWPERFTPRYYQMKRRRLSPNEYTRLYELRCQSDDEKLVSALGYYVSEGMDTDWCKLHPEQIEAHQARLQEIKNGEHWLSIDPSATSGRHSSETAATEIVITAGGQAYVEDAWFFPGNPVKMQEWIVQKITSGTIAYVLVEAQGGMKGQVVLWREYIERRLKELNFRWKGNFLLVNTQGKGGGQQIGKRQRLKNCSGLLQNGLIKFPGRLNFNPNLQVMEYRCSDRDKIQKLTKQIVNFPMGTSDGVDTITQWLIYCDSRLRREGDDVTPTITSEFEDTMKSGMMTAMADLRNPKPTNDSEEEEKWMSGRFSQSA